MNQLDQLTAAEAQSAGSNQAWLSRRWLSASHGLSWLFLDSPNPAQPEEQRLWLGRGQAGGSLSNASASFAALSFLELFEGRSSRWAAPGAELRSFTVQEFFAWAEPMAELAQDKVAWEPVSEAAWQAQWTWMQERWLSSGSSSSGSIGGPSLSPTPNPMPLQKAVPVIFESGTAASSCFETWWLRRLLWAVRSAIETRAAGGQAWAYAYWDAEEAVIGVTPEILFEQTASSLKTHAVAGTRWVREEQRESELAEFLRASKDSEEQALVVEDLRARLQELTRDHGGSVQVGGRLARAASPSRGGRQLWHLVTPLEWRSPVEKSSAGSGLAWTQVLRALHPTPALGVAPRSASWLKQFDEARRAKDGIERGNFGAPIVFAAPDFKSGEERLTALVGIRQIRVLRPRRAERFQVMVAAGAGVLPSSDRDSEWRELAAKREAIKRMLGLASAQGNVEAGVDVLLQLIEAGARSFVCCAGARNAPLVAALEILREAFQSGPESLQLEVTSHFEEREAAFFALGRARRDARPAVVLCTSGTAVAELLPAITEALYVGAPLVALTADRPKRLRGSGAPQAIDQREIFGRQVKRFIDFEVGDSLNAYAELMSAEALNDGPTHVNFCCDEPLLSGVEAAVQRASNFKAEASSRSADELAQVKPSRSQVTSNFQGLSLDAQTSTLMLVSGLQARESEAVVDFLVRAGRPVWLESTSGLRGDPRLQHLELQGGEAVVSRAIREGRIQQVWRLGSVPTTRLWRDLDDVRSPADTLSISHLQWSGLGRGRLIVQDQWWKSLRELPASPPQGDAARLEAELRSASQREAARLQQLLHAQSLAEPAWFHFISEKIPSAARVYVGNSLPIREWDLAASRSPSTLRRIEANRGVNGIDGQVSTALGLASAEDELWIIVGDLTALYNLAGPWLREKVRRLRLVVINNGGGRIFSRVFRSSPGGSAAFENRHAQSLAAWGELWDLESFAVRERSAWPELNDLDHVFIEIHPDPEATSQFWSAWESAT